MILVFCYSMLINANTHNWSCLSYDVNQSCFNINVSVDSNLQVSPWHDIPLQLGDGVFNFVVEIPKETSAKMEVATEEIYTPIKQDTKKGKLRFYP